MPAEARSPLRLASAVLGLAALAAAVTLLSCSSTAPPPGMSHLRFDASGRILYHRDYWDASGALGLHVPLVTRILNAVRSRLH